MKVDLFNNTSLAASKQQLKKLSEQVAKILLELKVPPGRRLFVEIQSTSAISRSERSTLLAELQSQPKQEALIDLLKNPKSRLIEAKIHQRVIHLISDIPLNRGARISIKPESSIFVTPASRVTSPPSTPASSTPTTIETSLATKQAESAIRQDGRDTAPLIQRDGKTRQSTGLQTIHNLNVQAERASTPPGTNGPEPKSLSLHMKGASTPQSLAKEIRSNLSGAPQHKESPPNGIKEAGAAKVELTAEGRNVIRTRPPENIIAQARTAASDVLRANLPIATPAAEALRRVQLPVNNISASQNTPLDSIQLSSKIKPLYLLLSKIFASPVLVTKTGVAPHELQNAIENSGIFLEQRIAKIAGGEKPEDQINRFIDRDLKAISSQALNWLSVVRANEPPTGDMLKTGDAVEKMLSLIFGKTPQSGDEGAARQQQLTRLEIMAKQVFAQISTRQIQNLASVFKDSSAPQSPITMDIPLRLPDGLFNASLSLFAPVEERQSEGDKRKKPKHSLKKRWKLFLELDLEERGSLATELQIQEENIEATMWADNSDLRNLASSHLHELQKELHSNGLKVVQLCCAETPVPKERTPQSGRFFDPIVDLET